jgi:ADP-heptose:LPS heptosyltransferase
MDSSNLHLAALAGVPTVSIWGATHPDIGFAPYGESKNNTIIQINTSDLPCRPCAVFGDKPCYRGDHACMKNITPEQVALVFSALYA